jgi:dihydroorotate dehydrogenase (NAD+) catalytic subunit
MSSGLPTPVDLSVQLGRLSLRNPILTASGTFGYAREMERLVDFSRLGGILPKTVTRAPRPGNLPWRTIETAAGMLNAIGLDNDGSTPSLSTTCRISRACRLRSSSASLVAITTSSWKWPACSTAGPVLRPLS